MITALTATTTERIVSGLLAAEGAGGSRVLTLVIGTDGAGLEAALEAAHGASLDHPCRIIAVVSPPQDDGPPGPRQQTGLVDVVRGQGERVARAASCHRVGAEQGPGARDDGLQRLVRVSGRDVGPQLLDELVLAHGGALGQGEGVDERRSAPGERAPVAGGRLVEQTKTRRPAGRGRPGGRAGLHH